MSNPHDELIRLRTALEFYANRANWTNHEDWPTSDRGQNVFTRDSVRRRDMDTSGWIEAQEALNPGCVEPERPSYLQPEEE